MKNKIGTRVGSLALGAVLAASAVVPSVFAATTYTPVAGTSCNFNKYLIMDAGDSVPNATFSFTVAPGTARSADTSDNAVMQVLPGVGTPTIADVTFAPGDATVTEAGTNIDVARDQEDRTGTAGTDTVQLDAGEKYATKQATVDFSGITFDEPGIYRYIITETANADHAAAGIIHDTDVDRVLDVYVVDNTTAATPAVTEAWIYEGQEYATEAEAHLAADTAQGASPGEGDYTYVTHREAVPASGGANLSVAAYVLHTADDDVVINTTMGSADVATAAAALDDKTDGFTNEYVSKDLVFKKEVTGNQASRDKWFEFTATLANVNDEDVYTVSLADDGNANTTDGNADATSGTTAATRAANQGKTNPTSVTGAQLKAGVKFYLQHGQSIAIRGIAPNATYTVTEDEEDYKKTASVVTGYEDVTTGTIGTVADSNTVSNAKAVMTSFQNERSGIIPTGVLVSVIPGALLVIGAGAGLYATKRKKKEDEEA